MDNDLAGSVELRTFSKGAQILRENQPNDNCMYILFAGNLAITKKVKETGQEKFLRTLGPGSFFGETALFRKSPRSANVIVLTDSATVGVLSEKTFIMQSKKNPKMVIAIIKGVLKRLLEIEDRVNEIEKIFQNLKESE